MTTTDIRKATWLAITIISTAWATALAYVLIHILQY